jgi:phage regulator Rha-like protein
MSSREIAELTGKEHKNVLADVRNMLEQLGMHSAEFSAQYKDSTGRSLLCFNLPKDLTITLVSGYSIPMRHRIVTRWLELEKAVKPVQPAVSKDPLDLLMIQAQMFPRASSNNPQTT